MRVAAKYEPRLVALNPLTSLHGGHSAPACAHSDDGLVELVKRAIACRMDVFAVTLHAPKPGVEFLDDCDIEQNLTPAASCLLTCESAVAALELQDQLKATILLPLMVETDVTPTDCWPSRMAALMEVIQPDYVVASCHHVNNIAIDESELSYWRAVEAAGGEAAAHLLYYDALAQLIHTVHPFTVGHLDVIRRFASRRWPDRSTRQRCLSLLDQMAVSGVALELNASPLQDGDSQAYPSSEILTEAERRGISLTLADDSHDIGSVGSGLERACSLAAGAGYREMLTLVEDA